MWTSWPSMRRQKAAVMISGSSDSYCCDLIVCQDITKFTCKTEAQRGGRALECDQERIGPQDGVAGGAITSATASPTMRGVSGSVSSLTMMSGAVQQVSCSPTPSPTNGSDAAASIATHGCLGQEGSSTDQLLPPVAHSAFDNDARSLQ